MSTGMAVDDARHLLRRLAAGDEICLDAILRPGVASGTPTPATAPLLDTRTRLLVQLAALLALDASTESLRWAVDLASAAGADDDALTAVLIVSGHTAGSAQLATSASRLATALGIERDGDDRVCELRLLPEQAGVRGAFDGL
jgi:alkylhydroperoxidase/carboxymuconolactone decarboxylase family protein YurZ